MSGEGIRNSARVGNVGGVNGTAPVDGGINASLVSRASRQVRAAVQTVRENLPTINIPSPTQIRTNIADAFRNFRARDNAPAQENQEATPQTRARSPFVRLAAAMAFGGTTDIFAGTFSAGNRTKVSDGARDSLATKLVTPTLADPNKMQVERIEGVITNSRGADLKGHFHNANALYGRVNTDKVVLFLSGSGGSCEDYSKDIANKYTRNGVSVMAVNYRGFSDNAGIPSENGLYKDARAMFNYLTSPQPDGRGIAPENVIIHGFSLGGPVAANLVKELQNSDISVKGLVLDRPMASMKGAVIGSTGNSIAASLSKKYVGSFDIEKKLNALPNKDIPIVLTTDREFLHDSGEALRNKSGDIGLTNIRGQTYNVEHEDSAALMNVASYWDDISNAFLH